MAKRIIVVEDDHSCEMVLRRVIRSVDPEAIVDWEESAEDALRTLDQESAKGRDYDLIIADIFLMGRATGLDLWNICQARYPDIPVLVTSSLPVDRFFETIGPDTISPPFMPKPFYIGECRQILEGLLSYR